MNRLPRLGRWALLTLTLADQPDMNGLLGNARSALLGEDDRLHRAHPRAWGTIADRAANGEDPLGALAAIRRTEDASRERLERELAEQPASRELEPLAAGDWQLRRTAFSGGRRLGVELIRGEEHVRLTCETFPTVDNPTGRYQGLLWIDAVRVGEQVIGSELLVATVLARLLSRGVDAVAELVSAVADGIRAQDAAGRALPELAFSVEAPQLGGDGPWQVTGAKDEREGSGIEPVCSVLVRRDRVELKLLYARGAEPGSLIKALDRTGPTPRP